MKRLNEQNFDEHKEDIVHTVSLLNQFRLMAKADNMQDEENLFSLAIWMIADYIRVTTGYTMQMVSFDAEDTDNKLYS